MIKLSATLGILFLTVTLGGCNNDSRRSSSDRANPERAEQAEQTVQAEQAERTEPSRERAAAEDSRESARDDSAEAEARAELLAAAENVRNELQKAAKYAKSRLEDAKSDLENARNLEQNSERQP